MVQHDDTIRRTRDEAEIMRHQQDSDTTLPNARNERHHGRGLERTERGRRLVEKEIVRLPRDLARNGDEPPLSTGERSQGSREIVDGEADSRKDLVGGCVRPTRRHQATTFATENEVFGDAQALDELDVLPDHGDVTITRLNRPCLDRQLPSDGLDERGLACPVVADEADELPRVDHERDVVEHHDGAVTHAQTTQVQCSSITVQRGRHHRLEFRCHQRVRETS